MLETVYQTEGIPLTVQRYIDGGLEKDLIDSDNGENIDKKAKLRTDGGNVTAALDELMLFGKGSPMVEFFLGSMIAYLSTRKV